MNRIDWKFIGTREGRLLYGTVPDWQHSHSGVTIATGFDIGNASDATFVQLPKAFAAKLAPYRNLVGIRALTTLHRLPLQITEEEAEIVDAITKEGIVEELERIYGMDAGVPFDGIPSEAQTVIASVTMQYGRPWDKTPHFWKHCCEQNWQQVHSDLLNFGDKYKARRKVEADYLAKLLKGKKSNEPANVA